MKILVTGTAGFIGYHLAKKLLELKNEGITDILIDTHRPEFSGMPNELSKKNDILVNKLVKKIQKKMEKINDYSNSMIVVGIKLNGGESNV